MMEMTELEAKGLLARAAKQQRNRRWLDDVQQLPKGGLVGHPVLFFLMASMGFLLLAQGVSHRLLALFLVLNLGLTLLAMYRQHRILRAVVALASESTAPAKE